MANKRNKNSRTRTGKRINPMSRIMARPQRPIVSFDGTVLNNSFIFSSATVASNYFATQYYISAVQTNGVAQNMVDLMKHYSEYKYLKATAHWIPQIGPGQAGAGGICYIAYVESPELMTIYNALATDALKVAAIKGMRDCITWNTWERFTYNIPLTNRRKQFDVDIAPASISNDELDRSTQGSLIFGIEGINASETLGKLRANVVIRLHGLTTNMNT